MPPVLTSKNLELYAARYYRNPHILDPDEFKEDLARFKYVKKLLSRYSDTSDLQVRLILNHLITIYNVFEIHAANEMFLTRTPEKSLPALKTFLVFLNYLPTDSLPTIQLDLLVAKALKDL